MRCKGCEQPQYEHLLEAKGIAVVNAEMGLLAYLPRVAGFDGPHTFNGIAVRAGALAAYLFVSRETGRVGDKVWAATGPVVVPGLALGIAFDRCTCWDILAEQLATAAELAGLE